MNRKKLVYMTESDHFISDGADRRILSSGGGCLSIFGLPFLAAGLFMLYAFLGGVPITNEDGTPVEAWGRVVFFFMGLIFSCVGSGLVFGRHKIVIDRAQGTLDKEWTVFFTVKKEIKRLRAFKEVAIKFERGDSDTSERYPVVLVGPDGETNIASPLQFGRARETALVLSDFLHLPLEDRTTDHAKVFTPEGTVDIQTVRQPKNMRSRVKETPEVLEIFMPQSRGLGCAAVMMTLVPVIFVVQFFPPLHKLADFSFDFHNPSDIFGTFFFGLFFLFMLLMPLTFVLRVLLKRKNLGTSLRVTQHALEIRDHFSRSNTQIIPLGDVISIERAKERKSEEMMHDNTLLGGANPFQPEYEKRKKTAEKTLAVISKFGLAKGNKIILKTKDEIIETGYALSGDEADYLCHLIAKRLPTTKG